MFQMKKKLPPNKGNSKENPERRIKPICQTHSVFDHMSIGILMQFVLLSNFERDAKMI